MPKYWPDTELAQDQRKMKAISCVHLQVLCVCHINVLILLDVFIFENMDSSRVIYCRYLISHI